MVRSDCLPDQRFRVPVHTTQLRGNILQRQMPTHSDQITTIELWRRAMADRYWACAENNNVERQQDGSTELILPGDPRWEGPSKPETPTTNHSGSRPEAPLKLEKRREA